MRGPEPNKQNAIDQRRGAVVFLLHTKKWAAGGISNETERLELNPGQQHKTVTEFEILVVDGQVSSILGWCE